MEPSHQLIIHMHEPVGAVAVTDTSATLDISADGTLLGIEILNVTAATGTPVAALDLGVRRSPDVRATYDPAEDAFYLELGVGHSRVQAIAGARLVVDSRGWLTSIEFPWEIRAPAWASSP